MLFYTNFKIIKKQKHTLFFKLKKKKLNKNYLRGEMPAGVFWFIFRPTISGPRDASIQ